MGKVVFSGHGAFDPSTNPPSTTVPDGSVIHFYSEGLKALLDSYGGDIESMSGAFDSASPSQSVDGGNSVPNYTLYDTEGLDIKDAPDGVDQIINFTGSRTLHEYFWEDGLTGEFHWAACRVVPLNEVGGALIGANANQDQFGNEGGEVTGTDSDSPWVQWAEDWLAAFWNESEETQVSWFESLESGQKRLMADYSSDLGTWARQRGYAV